MGGTRYRAEVGTKEKLKMGLGKGDGHEAGLVTGAKDAHRTHRA